MKKIIALVLTACLMMAVPACAETIEAVQIDWTEQSEQEFVDAGYSGSWVELESVGCRLIIPEGYEQTELSEEDVANEYVCRFYNAENGGAISVFDSHIEGMEDLSSLGAALKAQYPERTLQYLILNGAAAVASGVEEYDIMNVIFDLGDSRFVQIMFSPMSEANELLTACIASIQFDLAE